MPQTGCIPNSVPTALPGLPSSLDYCIIYNSTLKAQAMNACCDSGTLELINDCNWCPVPSIYLKKGQSAQSIINQFNACLQSAGGLGAGLDGAFTCHVPNSAVKASATPLYWVCVVLLVSVLFHAV